MSIEENAPVSAVRLLALVDAMAGQRVLLLADLVADRFVHGTPKRISREAPVLILRWAGEAVVPGGGANAVVNVRALGGEPLVFGVVGDDAAGGELRQALAAREVATGGILDRPGYRTPTKTRIVAGFPTGIKQQVVRLDHEQEACAPISDELERLEREIRAVAGVRVAVLSDYGYGIVAPELVAAVRAAVGPQGVILVDSRFRLAAFRGIDGATPNEEEAEALLGRPLDDPEGDDGRAGREIRETLGARFLLVTRGSRGMSLFEAAGATRIPVHGTDQVADVTGAGDTVIGTFALALAAGATPVEAALLANFAGGVVVMKAGTATVSPDELRHAIRSDRRPREEMRWAKS
ncbi:MAG: bifunctional heptose 7-phosphate kinase/heptose 1-phosphate adenyltransferase [Thermoanaerobaculia bacterium]